MAILRTSFVATVLGLAAAHCSPTQAHGEFVPAAPYHELATFSFASNEGPPGGYRLSARSLVVEEMKPLVAAELIRRGYVQAPDGEGDVIVACGAGRRDATRHVRLSWRITSLTGEALEDQDFVEGGVVIDAFDKSGGQIWHGAARTPIDPMKPSEARLRAAVAAALARFPAHDGKR
ncbi:MAG TPA: DUF4136 domain-containing protein [Polyangiaceae bacterium]|jgi:hypothetical protein